MTRKPWTIVVGLSLAAAVQPLAAAEPLERMGLIVVVRNYAAAPPTIVARAQEVAAAPYARIGIDVRWMDEEALTKAMGTDPDSSCALARSVILLNIVPSVPGERHALGVAVSGVRLVRIAFDKVRDVAETFEVDQAVLLGHVMAHEIGHALLPPNAHTLAGLMRARLDLRLAGQASLGFRDEQPLHIRSAVRQLSGSTCK